MRGAIGRRRVLQAGVGFGVGVRLGQGLAFGQNDPASIRPREGDLLVLADDASLKALAPGDLSINAKQVTAWAMDPADRTVRNGSRLNRLLLLHVDLEAAQPETQARAADGVVAYTAICPHTGCDVIDWLADERLLYCPCHFSKFDPRDGGKVVDGPAPRALPALPLAVAGGKLVVAKPFTSRVGFETA